MVICVRCVNAIDSKSAKKVGWERIDGRWYCHACKTGYMITKGDKNETKK